MSMKKARQDVDALLLKLRKKPQRVAGPTCFLSTQALTLDHTIGRGGLPGARVTVVSGPGSAGKTTLQLHLVKEVQRQGGIGAFIDKEHKVDPRWAKIIGVDWDRVLLLPEEGERQYLEGILEDFVMRLRVIRQERPDLPMFVSLDSINSTLSKAEYEAGFEDELMMDRARAYSQILPTIVEELDGMNVVFSVVCQYRTKIMRGMPAAVERVSGGNAPKHHAALVIDLYPGGGVVSNKRQVAQIANVRIYKNQVGGQPFAQTEFQIRYGYGIDSFQSLLDVATDLGIASAVKSAKKKKDEIAIDKKSKKDEEKKERKATAVEVYNQSGELFKCRGVWGPSGLLALERKHPGLVEHLCNEITEKQGFPAYNPLSQASVETLKQEDEDGDGTGD